MQSSNRHGQIIMRLSHALSILQCIMAIIVVNLNQVSKLYRTYVCCLRSKGYFTLMAALSALVRSNSSASLPSHSCMESAIWPRCFDTPEFIESNTWFNFCLQFKVKCNILAMYRPCHKLNYLSPSSSTRLTQSITAYHSIHYSMHTQGIVNIHILVCSIATIIIGILFYKHSLGAQINFMYS